MTNPHWTEYEFVVVDVEGNGQSPQEIIELAIVHLWRKHISPPRSWLIRPKKPISDQATNIHGIANHDLAGCLHIEDLAADIRTELGGRVVVGHNVGVDTQLMRRQLGEWNPIAILDTLKIAKYSHPGRSSYSLDALVEAYKLKTGARQRHRASGDAEITAELFLILVSELDHHARLDLLKLCQIGGSSDDPFIKSQQGNLF